MPSSFVLLLSFLVSVCALPPPGPKRFKPRLSFRIGAYTPEPFHPPSEDKVSTHYLTLSRSPGSLSHQYLRSLQKGNQVNGNYGFTQAVSDDYSTSFIASIEFANEMFQVIIDTGSSDTWLAETGYQCVDATTQALRPESYCDFGTLYNVSSTFKQIPNENFNIEYGDGEFLTGIFGTEKVMSPALPSKISKSPLPTMPVGTAMGLLVESLAWLSLLSQARTPVTTPATIPKPLRSLTTPSSRTCTLKATSHPCSALPSTEATSQDSWHSEGSRQ